ncbi:MAG TPA: FAD-dependent oxidoreductase [Candidatus Subteraquimicrobiales bacterium]
MIGIFRSMGVAMKHFFRKEITFQYPLEKRKLPPRFRGALAIKGSLDLENKNDLSPEVPPCQTGCPARVDPRGQSVFTCEQDIVAGFRLVQERNTLPGVLGAVCPHPCESVCTRGSYDKAIAIRSLHRHLSEAYFEKQRNISPIQERKKEKVAVIGAGPAGLTAAFDLTKLGYKVTVFEKEEKAGGMLYTGIPTYRLPREVLHKEIEDIAAYGFEIKTGVEVGKDITLGKLKKDFDAVLLSVGLQTSNSLPLPGADLKGVLLALPFLTAGNLGQKMEVGPKVAVVGGGNTAIDVTRVAVRLGAEKVILLYRRTIKEMPAQVWEVREAEEEGVEVKFLVGPVEIIGSNGKVTGIKCIKMELGEPDAHGRRTPVPIEGTEFVIAVDSVIFAVGQTLNPSFLSKDLKIELDKWGLMQTDEVSLESSVPGVFACGDAVMGPGIVVRAVASGHEAAISIDRYFKEEDLGQGRTATPKRWGEVIDWEEAHQKVSLKDALKGEFLAPAKPLSERTGDIEPLLAVSRQMMPILEPENRKTGFKRVELGLTAEESRVEAWRCLRCGSQICVACSICAQVCPTESITQNITQNGQRKIEKFDIDLRTCVFCGICMENCPTKTLFHTHEYELSVAEAEKLVYNKERLLREVPKESLPSGEEIPMDEATVKLYRWYK